MIGLKISFLILTLWLTENSIYGHDKSREIETYASLPQDKRPTLFYVAQGPNSLPPVKKADFAFFRQGYELLPS